MKNSSFGMLNMMNIKSAFVTFVYASIVAIIGYVVSVGDIFKLDFHALINVGVMAGFSTVITLLKAMTTTEKGKALGMKIK